MEYVTKQHRDGKFDLDHLEEELGDVLAYLGLIASDYGLSLKSIMEKNEAKLDARIGKP